MSNGKTQGFGLLIGVYLCSSVVFLVVCCGCKSIGPATVARDRFEYSGSISESWKRQTLLNIVNLRYVDPPIFVDVGQIVAGYTLETGATLGGNLSSLGAIQGNSISAGGSARYTDGPTITYTPLTGMKFVRALMTPLPPDSVLYTIQSGWPANAVFFASVAVMNGLKNQEASIAGVTPPDPKFIRVLELMRKIQASGSVGLRIRQDSQKQQTTVISFRAKNVSEQTLADIKELLHIMTTMASQVDAPAEDVAQGRTPPGLESTAEAETMRLIHIRSSKSKPADSYATVLYRDHCKRNIIR